MPLLIDGHNVIGSGVLPDIRLSDEDDEAKLVARLRVWKSRYRGRMTVIFDRGIAEGQARRLSSGGVQVRFVRNPREADDFIRRRIRQRPTGLVVVTNDAALRREALAHRVETWRADEFVRRMSAPRRRPKPKPLDVGAESHVHLSDSEVDEWLRFFEQRGPKDSGTESRKPRARKNAKRKSRKKGNEKDQRRD